MNASGGVDLGGTKIQAVIVDRAGGTLGAARRPTPQTGGPRAVMEEIARTLEEAAQSADLEPAQLAGVGVGSPGDVDAKRGTVAQARNLPDWDAAFPLALELGDVIGTPVVLGNDVQVATDAEFRLGAGKPYRSLLGVFWGTGVGGGLVLGGKPWVGRGAAAEIGHVVVKIGGARCTCGRRGCLEAYAGRGAMELRARRQAKRGKSTTLFEIMERRGRTRLTSGVWAQALADGDKLATKLIDRAVGALGAGIASALNLLDVDAVVVGGGLGIRFGSEYVERIRVAMMPHLFASDRPPPIMLAGLGDLGGAIGAAMLVPSAQGRPGARRASDGRRAAARH
jgi:glucokinase